MNTKSLIREMDNNTLDVYNLIKSNNYIQFELIKGRCMANIISAFKSSLNNTDLSLVNWKLLYLVVFSNI